MSKIGRFVVAQMERGNYTVNERTGECYVRLTEDRIKRAIAAQDSTDPIRQDESGRQREDRNEKDI